MMIRKILILLILFVTSCATKEEAIKTRLDSAWKEYYTKSYYKTSQLDIFVVTNRKQLSSEFSCVTGSFDVFRSEEVSYGKCNINIPKDRLIGEIPEVVTTKGFIHKDFKILQEESLKEDQLIKNIKLTNRNPLIFVHGFNVKYHEAVIRAAALAYDLKYQGPIILFSWPAGGSGASVVMIDKTYKDNLINAISSVNDFSAFLVLLKNNKITPNIVVHSMGHQVVLSSMEALSKKYPKAKFANKLILNAPDFEEDKFNEIKRDIQKVVNNITIYCAQNDKAISVSANINKSKRLGGCSVINHNQNHKIDLIDVTSINDSFLGHGYYYSRDVLADMFQNLIGIDAKKRMFITEKDFLEGQYYLRK